MKVNSAIFEDWQISLSIFIFFCVNHTGKKIKINHSAQIMAEFSFLIELSLSKTKHLFISVSAAWIFLYFYSDKTVSPHNPERQEFNGLQSDIRFRHALGTTQASQECCLNFFKWFCATKCIIFWLRHNNELVLTIVCLGGLLCYSEETCYWCSNSGYFTLGHHAIIRNDTHPVCEHSAE